ncbi:MAG TPA: V-type ATP synthase subunit E [Dissulfurispiraceae bacterium]|nr:V-type ATP synthase subunit E [Dissulfurispiraceae bacterium]
MGDGEFIEALRREGEEKIRTICQEAESEAERIRLDAAGRINRIRENLGRTHSIALKEQSEAMVSAADREARMVLLSAEKELACRFYAAAVKALAWLREKEYPEVFDALAHELPLYDWQVVRVNPHDSEKAKACFPGSEIVLDEGISGGMDVTDKEGKIRVVNTFEKRLENAWTDILTELIKDVYGKIPECGVPEKN